MEGTEQKDPKIVSASIQALTTTLHEFGFCLTINPEPIIKKISDWFSDRDKGVRDEARLLVIEMYKWMGPSLKNHLQAANLESVQMTELEAEFAKVEGQKAVPTRYVRSQQQKQAKLAASAEETNEGGDEGDEDEAPQEIDPYDLADPVDILSKLRKEKQNVAATDETYLTVHNERGPGNDQFICDMCHKGFTRRYHLERHMSTHKPDKSFVCSVCKKAFKHKESMTRHFRQHVPGRAKVQEEVMEGTEQKYPKIVSASIQALTTTLHEFGFCLTINPEPIIKKISDWFSDRDKGVRDEARLLVIEMYKWMGPSLKNHLQAANLESVQMTELEAEFAKVEGQKAVPTRYISSQQQKQAKLAASAEETNDIVMNNKCDEQIDAEKIPE